MKTKLPWLAAGLLALGVLPGSSFGQSAFNYGPITNNITGATLSVDFAAFTADPFVGTTAVNQIALWNVQSMTSYDLTAQMFGNAVWPNPPQVNQGPLQTGFVSVNIDPAFFNALASGTVGLTALFTDTGDSWFAIDTIQLSITTSAGVVNAYYGSLPNGFGLGIPVGGDLPGPLPGSLPYNGTGFDEPISGKSIDAVPEPASWALLALGALMFWRGTRATRARAWARKKLPLYAVLLTFATVARAQPAAPQAASIPGAGNPAAPGSVQSRPPTEHADILGREFVPGELLVSFKPGVSAQARSALAAKTRLSTIAEYPAVHVQHLRVHDGQTVLGAVAALRADPSVSYASPNYVDHPMDNPNLVQPNDPQYPRQWHLNNNGRQLQRIPNILHDETVNANGFYDIGEGVYEDRDGSGTVTVGDIRLLAPANNPGLPTGVAVAAPDADAVAAGNLVTFAGNENYYDANGNGVYDAGETIYINFATNGVVSLRDLRASPGAGPVGSRVSPGDADLPCRNLTRFRSGDVLPIIDADIDAPQSWVFGTDCSTSIVAIIDTGLDVNHPDLAANLWTGPGGIHGQSFAGREKHIDYPKINSLYDAGEAVYLDADNSAKVNAGDIRLVPVSVNGQNYPALSMVTCGDEDTMPLLLINFRATEKYYDGNGNGAFNRGELIYTDNDNSGKISAGDLRMVSVTAGAPPVTYAAGTTVAVGDKDVGFNLTAFQAAEMHDTTGAVGPAYTNTDGIYLDNNDNQRVTRGQTRITPAFGSGLAAGAVNNGDADVTPWNLVQFYTGQASRHELHTDQVTANGNFDPGEFVYNHATPSGNVGVGDTRLTQVTEGANVYAAGSVVAGPDADANPRSLFAFVAAEEHTEAAPANGQYDNGEFIYLDADSTGTVSVGDTRLTDVPGAGNAGTMVIAGDADVDRPGNPNPLIAFNANEKHDRVAGAGNFVQGDGIYRDTDNSGGVTVNDTRITPPTGSGLTASVAVAAPDNDVLPRLLVGFQATERHSDPNNNSFFDPGEIIILDADNNGRISAGDTRLTADFAGAANTVVAANSADVGLPLVGFYNYNAINEAHDEHVAADGRFNNGEKIYNDVDSSGTVTVGDIRLLDVPGPGVTIYRAGSTVAAGDADLTLALTNFAVDVAQNDITDTDGHGTAVAGVIGAVGNNGINIAGVCWQARIMGLRTGFAQSSTIACLNYIAARKTAGDDIRVVNMSLGGKGYNQMLKDTINNTANTGSGMLFTISAGNDGTDNDDNGQPLETIYRTAGAAVAVGDTRVTAFGPPAQGLGPGVVAAGNADVGKNVVNFLPIEKYYDANGNNSYNAGEMIYQDMDGSGTVSVNDVRMAAFTSGGAGTQYPAGVVNAGDPDVGRALKSLANYTHIDLGTPVYFDGAQPGYPASYNLPRIISVAASDASDNLASFSCWGTNSVNLVAPGVGILTLKPTNLGGGVTYINGTSFSSPLVAGILYHMWTRPAFLSMDPDSVDHRLLAQSLNGLNFSTAGPHGTDHRYGLRKTVSSGGTFNDGTARMDSGDDFGDAPDPPYPTQISSFTSTNYGARAEDLGDEWLGRDPALPPQWVYLPTLPAPPPPTGSTPEYDAFNNPLWPLDPDGTPNLVNNDAADNGVVLLGPFQFSPPGGPPLKATVRVFINTANNDVTDGDGGRYANVGGTTLGNSVHLAADGVHNPADNKNLWVNAWFDWNRNGSFEDPGEQAFMLACNPTAWNTNGTNGPSHGGVYDVTFNMPVAPTNAQPGAGMYARFRLDYGENSGQPILPNKAQPVLPHDVGPSPGGQVMFWDDAPGLPLPNTPVTNRWESVPLSSSQPSLYLSRGLARYGEVEDYLVSSGSPDQIHLYGPNTNGFFPNTAQTLTAKVENSFVALPGQTVIFTAVMGSAQFTSGAINSNSSSSSVVTDPYGSAPVNFIATNAGTILISATVSNTSQTAYFFGQCVATPQVLPGLQAPGQSQFVIHVTGPASQGYHIERSSDLTTWQTIGTVTVPNDPSGTGTADFSDPNPPPNEAFYRVVP